MKKTILSLAAIAMMVKPAQKLVAVEEKKGENVDAVVEETVDEYEDDEEAEEAEEDEDDWEEIQSSFDEEDEKEARRRASAHYDHRQHYRY